MTDTATRRGYWLVALALLVLMLAAGAPSPLFVVYQARWGFSALALTAAFAVYALALLVALLVTALAIPVVDRLARWGVPRGLASLLTVAGGLAAVALLLTFVGQQVAGGASDLADSTVQGLGKVKDWLKAATEAI